MVEFMLLFYPLLPCLTLFSVLFMPSCLHGPDTRLDGRALYDTDSKLAGRPLVVCTLGVWDLHWGDFGG
jgi:hypothetical protein